MKTMPRKTFYQNRIIALTGAAQGLGRALVFGLAARGGRLALCDRNPGALADTAGELRAAFPESEIVTEVIDISREEDITIWTGGLERQFGRVDILFNNAGIAGKTSRIDELEMPEMDRIMSVNFRGPAMISLKMLPLLRKSPGPVLVNVSSIAGLMGIMGALPYAASKSALRGFTESLRHELMDEGFRVVQVHPGVIKTSIVENVEGLSDEKRRKSAEAFRSQKGLEPDAAAEIILGNIARGRDRILVGNDSIMGDWISRWFPVRSPGMVHRQLREIIQKLEGNGDKKNGV